MEGVSSTVQERMVSISILLIADPAIAVVLQWVASAPQSGGLRPRGARDGELADEGLDESGGLQ
jgi:hypothetical protein